MSKATNAYRLIASILAASAGTASVYVALRGDYEDSVEVVAAGLLVLLALVLGAYIILRDNTDQDEPILLKLLANKTSIALAVFILAHLISFYSSGAMSDLLALPKTSNNTELYGVFFIMPVLVVTYVILMLGFSVRHKQTLEPAPASDPSGTISLEQPKKRLGTLLIPALLLNTILIPLSIVLTFGCGYSEECSDGLGYTLFGLIIAFVASFFVLLLILLVRSIKRALKS